MTDCSAHCDLLILWWHELRTCTSVTSRACSLLFVCCLLCPLSTPSFHFWSINYLRHYEQTAYGLLAAAEAAERSGSELAPALNGNSSLTEKPQVGVKWRSDIAATKMLICCRPTVDLIFGLYNNKKNITNNYNSNGRNKCFEYILGWKKTRWSSF